MVPQAVRGAAAAVILAAAVALAARMGIQRYRVNILKQRIEQQTIAAMQGRAGDPRRVAARNLAAAREALALFPADIDLHLELAASYRLAGDLAGAERAYQEALGVARRPEIFVNLASVQLARGDLEGAAQTLEPLYRHNPGWLDPETRALVGSRVDQRDDERPR